MEERQRHQLKSALLKCANENEGRGFYTGRVLVPSVCRSAVESIEELEKTLQRIAEIVPNSYKNYRYMPEARLDIIGAICEEVLR